MFFSLYNISLSSHFLTFISPFQFPRPLNFITTPLLSPGRTAHHKGRNDLPFSSALHRGAFCDHLHGISDTTMGLIRIVWAFALQDMRGDSILLSGFAIKTGGTKNSCFASELTYFFPNMDCRTFVVTKQQATRSTFAKLYFSFKVLIKLANLQ